MDNCAQNLNSEEMSLQEAYGPRSQFTILVVPLSEYKCITHDGDVELGVFNMSAERFCEMCQIKTLIVHWKPDPKGTRYKRVNFQRTEKVAGKDALEGMNSEGTALDKFRRDRVV